MSQFDAVLFDMDGLLLDTERAYKIGFDELGAGRGILDTDAIYRSMVGLTWPDIIALLSELVGSEAEARALYDQWVELVHAKLEQEVPLRPRVLELLTAIDLPKAVVTSSTHAGAEMLLAGAGIRGHFDALIAGDRVPQPKPHPTPYLMGAEALGVDIARCAAFEDSPTGIRAAVASGARAVQIPDMVPVDDETRALGHVIAPDIYTGAKTIGLI